MKGGKDMKKIYKYYFDDKTYKLKLNNVDKFIISNDTLEFNGNQFYENIFKEYSEDDDIVIENEMTEEEMKSNKFAQPILDMIKEMIDAIVKKISEEKAQ